MSICRAQAFLLIPLLGGVLGAADSNSAAGPASSGVATAGVPVIRTSSLELLARAVESNPHLYAGLESFVCAEQVERFRGTGAKGANRHVDTVDAQVSFENGVERYSMLRRKHYLLPTMAVLDGAWSEGEFGMLVKQTEQLLKTQKATFDHWTEVDGIPAGLYHFDVAREVSPWDLKVGARHYTIPFRTDVWLAQETGEIIKLARSSTNLPYDLNISKVDWSISLKPVNLSGKSWLLPDAADYAVSYADSGEWDRNAIRFSDYHRYGSDSAVRIN